LIVAFLGLNLTIIDLKKQTIVSAFVFC